MRVWAAMVWLVCAAVAARAGERDADPARAKSHFELGRSYYEAQRWPEAAGEFLEAYRLRPLPILLWNAAQSYRHAGDNARAVELYRRYLAAQATGGKRDEAQRYLAELIPAPPAPAPAPAPALPAPAPARDDLHTPEFPIATTTPQKPAPLKPSVSKPATPPPTETYEPLVVEKTPEVAKPNSTTKPPAPTVIDEPMVIDQPKPPKPSVAPPPKPIVAVAPRPAPLVALAPKPLAPLPQRLAPAAIAKDAPPKNRRKLWAIIGGTTAGVVVVSVATALALTVPRGSSSLGWFTH